jgi:hypothetical protein
MPSFSPMMLRVLITFLVDLLVKSTNGNSTLAPAEVVQRPSLDHSQWLPEAAPRLAAPPCRGRHISGM